MPTPAKPKPKPSALVAEVGPRFAAARKALGRKQLDLAEALGIDQERLSKFENGKRGLQSETLLALLKLLADAGISVDGFILRGLGEPVRREPLLIAANEELADGLRELAARVEKGRHPSSKPPGPRHKR